MRIDGARCTECAECIPYCPAGAISAVEGTGVVVDEDSCFDCGLCRLPWLCPEEAFRDSADAAAHPRVLRSFFSDPNTTHAETLTPGRGTEEAKTNDVTGRVRRGEVGLCIELGRPCTGCSLEDVSFMTRLVHRAGARFMQGNPLVSLMDPNTGRLDAGVRTERVLSAIIEIVFPAHDLETILGEVMAAGQQLDTVFSLSLITRLEEDGGLSALPRLRSMGFALGGNAKVNLGMGSPLVAD